MAENEDTQDAGGGKLDVVDLAKVRRERQAERQRAASARPSAASLRIFRRHRPDLSGLRLRDCADLGAEAADVRRLVDRISAALSCDAGQRAAVQNILEEETGMLADQAEAERRRRADQRRRGYQL